MNVFKSLPVLSVLWFGPITTTQLPAQVFSTLHSFNGGDGSYPRGSLVLSGNNLYGTANSGGTANKGTVFALKTDGTSVTNLHSFIGTDGAYPDAGLVLSDSTLYGTTPYGGSSSNGTVFSVKTDGTGFKILHEFTATSGNLLTNVDGANAFGGWILSGDTLYGTRQMGGSSGNSTVFALTTNGSSFRTLHSFISGEGLEPNGLVLSDNALYGTTFGAGGTIFKLNPDGTGFTNIHSFAPEGIWPSGGLIVSNNTLYGTTSLGGISDKGIVFAVNTDGTGFSTLHTFTGGSDGANPQGGLLLWRDVLFSTTYYNDDGTKSSVFAVNSDGTGFSTLQVFTGGTAGGGPLGSLVISSNRLFGTTSGGGNYGYGTVFSFDVLTPLSVAAYGGNLIVAWPSRPSGLTLQSTTNLVSPVWTTVSPGPSALNGQNIVIHPASGEQQFFRLSQ